MEKNQRLGHGNCGGMLRVSKLIVWNYMAESKQIHFTIAGRDSGSTGNRTFMESS